MPISPRLDLSEGIRFECQGSGNCCTSRGQYGYVYLSDFDAKRMAKELRLPLQEFKKHCEVTEGHLHLKDPDKDCLFVKDARCMVYLGRPAQCRTWPFWPENMNAKTWNTEVKQFCPGVGKGRLYSAREIRTILKTQAGEV